MLEKGARVIAVEKDRKFAELLHRFDNTKLQIFEEDFLTFALDKHLQEGTKVIANLPYHLTTPILERLLPLFPLISSLTLMVQAEVGQRICASKGSKIYGSLSLFVQYYAEAHYGGKVSANCFYPKPNVDSAVIHLKLKPRPARDNTLFFTIMRTAFQQRRKMLRASLSELFPKPRIEQVLRMHGINPQARPEQLSLEEFLLVSESLVN